MKKQDKKQRKFNKNRMILVVILLLVIGAIIVAILHSKGKDYYSPESRVEQVKSTIIEDSETIGWVNVQGTDIDYPVVYETNLVYQGLKDYLWVSSMYEEGENRLAIFGHNIRNVSNKPLIKEEGHVRFEQLLSFVYYDFAKDNLYIQYSQNGRNELYKIYAIGFYEQDDEDGYSFSSEEEVKEYINNAKKNSIYDYKVDVKEDDFLISLITCTRFFGAGGKTTFKIDARKVRGHEKVDKYEVSKNKNYDVLNLK